MTNPYQQDPNDYTRPAPQPPYLPPTRPLPPQYPPPMSAPPISPVPLASQNMMVVQQTQPTTSGYATASLVFGILGLVTSCCSFGVFSIAAVILGHVALGETKYGRRGGHGAAVAGLILGYVIVVPAIILSIMFVFGDAMSTLHPSPSPTP